VRKGLGCEAVRLEKNTSTAELAAQALGCRVSQIVKSLLFLRAEGEEGEPILVLMGGARRVDVGKLEEYCGLPISKADAAQVKGITGFEIGGVPPLGHLAELETVMDARLMDEGEIWSAAGSAHAVFPADPEALRAATGAAVADVGEG